MGRGAPDYTRITEIKGLSPTATLVTIAVDANGQLYAVVKGQYGSTLLPIAVDSAGRIIMVPYGTTVVSGDVNATPTTTVRQVQGTDGATYRTLAVDASGQIIMVPRGQSGNYLDVDASGFLTSVMKGIDGVTLRTVAVDANGKILGVLQGDYAGTLKTLAVDSQGRMLAVLTDPEDVFGNPHYLGAAELAVRLGSIHRFERRGQVLFMEDFEEGINRWTPATASDNGVVDLTTYSSLSGRFACRLLTSTSSPYNAQIGRPEPYPTLSKMGMEVGIHADGNEDYDRIGLLLRQETQQYRFYLELDPVDKKLRYMNSSGTWTDIQSISSVDVEPRVFHRLKLVVDLVNKKYVRGLYDDQELNLANIDPHLQVTAVPNDVYMVVSVAGLSAIQRHIRVDDVILTQNEP